MIGCAFYLAQLAPPQITIIALSDKAAKLAFRDRNGCLDDPEAGEMT